MSGSSISRMRQAGTSGLSALDIVAGRSEGDGAHAVRVQQLAERLPDTFIVIDDEDDMVVRRHGAAFASIGNVKMNVAPCGSFFSAHNRPPCSSTIERQIASPMPMPFSFVVKNGSNILSGKSMPWPRSLISVWTTSPDPAHAHSEDPVACRRRPSPRCRCG